jgi:hypothetical protein
MDAANFLTQSDFRRDGYQRMSLLLKDALPGLADELIQLLVAAVRQSLADQVPGLKIVERCRCGDDFCASFYTLPKPDGSYGAGHENVVLEPERGMIVLDVVNGCIAHVEVLNRDEVRRALIASLP